MKIQRGFTLIELMISITIALLLLLILSQVYLSTFNVQRSQNDMTQVNETVRFSFDLLSKEIRKAGMQNMWQKGTVGVVSFCSTTTAKASILGLNDATTIDPTAATLTGSTVTVENSSDVLRVRFYGEDTAATESVYDCLGQPVAANTLVEDTLYIAKNPNNNNEPTLYCRTSNPAGASAQALISGVESMQFLYGEDTDGDGIIDRYIPWNKVANPDHIMSIKASVIARSANKVATDTRTTAQNYYHFLGGATPYPASSNSDTGAVFSAPADKRLRQILSTEIAVRNVDRCL